MTNVDSVAATQHGSLSRGWPAVLLTLCVMLAAVYSFSHRPPPPFPETRVNPDGLLVNALAQQGARMLAAGEQGRILIADSAEGPWREAKVEPQRHSTLTGLLFVDERTVLAVGHDSWILRSEDGGETWTEAHFASERSEPLLGVAGPYEGKLYAYGAFGQFLVSTDGAETWAKQTLIDENAKSASAAVEADPSAENYDPFAAYTDGATAASGLADRHLNAMTRTADGTLWLVGERGLLARSGNGGESWRVIDGVYAGSFFGILELPQNGLLIHGMRGNVFVTRDQGATWTAATVPMPVSLFDGVVDGEGHIVLVGAGDTVLKSTDQGASFELVSQKDRRGIAAVLALPGGAWLTGGEAGIKRQQPGIGRE